MMNLVRRGLLSLVTTLDSRKPYRLELEFAIENAKDNFLFHGVDCGRGGAGGAH